MNQNIQTAHKRNRWEAIKKIVYGAVWFLILTWFLHSSVTHSYNEFQLIRYGQTVEGIVTKYFEEIDENESSISVNSVCEYTFFLPDGTDIDGSNNVTEKINQGDLIEIQYVPTNPKINRVKGEGSSTIFDWSWRQLLGLGLLALFAAPGIILIRNGIKEFRNPKIINNLEEQGHLTPLQLSGYANDSLDGEEKNIVGRHLLVCEECRKLLPPPTKEQFLKALFSEENKMEKL